MSRHRCCVDGCFTKQDGELSFFRCPNNERSSNAWKQALGFTGKHRFANLTADQCNKRIKICSLHFDENSFTNPEGNRIHKFAIPSLNIETIDDINAILNDGPNISKVDVYVQTEQNAVVELKEVGKVELGTLNLTQICRTCKCVAPQMRSIFEEYKTAYQSPRIDEMLMACSSVQVLYGDDLPAQICQICVEQLRNAFVFKRQIERVDASLREYAKNVKVEIKQELKNLDFIEPLHTFSNFLNEQATDNNQKTSDTSVNSKTKTDYIQFLDNDQMLLTCCECSRIFTTLSGLRCHKRLHTGNLYKCSKCDKGYTRIDHLQRHEKSHNQRNAAFSDNSDVANCLEQVKVTENIDEAKVEEVVGGVNYIGEISNKYDNNLEEVKEYLKNELDDSKEVKVEDSLIMRDNILEDGYNSVNCERYVTESMDRDNIVEMVDTGLNDKENYLSRMIDNNDNNSNGKSREEVAECIGHETNGLKEMKVEDSLDMEDNFIEVEDKTINVEHAGENSEDSTDSEYLPKRSLLLNIKYYQAKNPQKLLKIKVSEEEYGEFPCPACQEMFTTMSALDKHARIKHEGLKVYRCNMCNWEFSRPDHLRRHAISHSAFKEHRCHMCTKSFKTRETLSRHQKLHERSRQFKCDICQTVFSRIDLLANHRASKHGIGEKVMVRKKYECPLCNMSFATENYRDIHVSRHTRQLNNECSNKLVCTECGRRFLRKDYLIAHMRRHRKEMFKCKYCEKGFPRLINLRVHERYHIEERSHLCTICGKGFGRAYNLTVHMRTHTREKPHRCTHCDAAFVQSNDLSIHIRRHTGERFQCEMCSKSFLMKYQLNQHKRTVHGLTVIQKQKKTDEPAPITAPLPKPIVLDNIIFNAMHAQLTAQSRLTKE